MSDFERGKGFGKKKFSQRSDRNDLKSPYNSRYFNKSIYNPDKESETENKVKVKQPQILIKTRDKTDERSLSPKRIVKDDTATVQKETSGSVTNETHTIPVKKMTKHIKLFVGGCLNTEELQEYLGDTQDFLVVGVIGPQGSGKSTIMNFLAANNLNENYIKTVLDENTESLEEEENKSFTENMAKLSFQDVSNVSEKVENIIFSPESVENIEKCTNATSGIDVYITESRVILLDCQPFLSISMQEDLNELKRCVAMYNDTPNVVHISITEEVQNLQYTAFLMSICNIVIYVQDYFLDCNYLRFLLTAEMLKPTIANCEEDYQDSYPHLFIVHNKCKMEDFSPKRFKTMQNLYRKSFCGSKLNLYSGMGMGSGKIINSLNPELCDEPINLFLLPDYEYSQENPYKGHPPFHELVQRLKMHVNCVAKYPVALGLSNEKMWLNHIIKVWDLVEKSSFFVDYSKVTN